MSIDTFTKDFTVKFRHADRKGLLSPAAVLNYFEEAAFGHADLLGVGYKAMLDARRVWILSRISVRMERRPRFGQAVGVTTWPRGSERLFAVRDYTITADGQTLIRARSNWLILDADRRRPLRPGVVMDRLPLNDGRDALEAAAALGEAEGLVNVMERKALYSDLDFNGHVHNTRYMQWICDLFEPDAIENAPSVNFDINYLKEITASSVTGLWMGKADDVYHIEGRQAGGAVFRARLQGIA